ncbi:MAG: hypothetical protein AAF843_03925 [Bacteroidota bacterium]
MSGTIYDRFYNALLGKETKENAEKVIIWLSIFSFIIHLIVIALVDFGFIKLSYESELLTNPISAIYTPFSFILLFEVYLLVYHIPKSTSNYIAKQYEIITLIMIRRIFKDLANLDLSVNWFDIKYDLQFTYDIISTILLFVFIYIFHRLNARKEHSELVKDLPEKVRTFIRRKRVMATFLVPVIIVMALYSFVNWFTEWIEWMQSSGGEGASFIDINNIFYDKFFTLLILTDVLLLLFSFFNTSSFHVFIRNSGFIISTILIRISFSTEGLINNLLILVAVIFGVIILWITQKYNELNDRTLQV